ncbi:ABC transporter permease [Streptococcus salivarius]|jgi:putative transporter|uniref:ABC transporter permease n=1 Tax=Streptococcus salivarius TaxID=1304 RepID=UPI0005F305C3|nr:ABC transporter permease [Streptococcus salivarius]KJU87990.1 lantibiotic immunity protein [Streptococcus salivarius]
MRYYILAEWKKLNKIQLLIIGIAFVALSSFIGLGTYFANQSVLIDGTQDKVMWGQLTFYYTQILYPPMIAIFIAISLSQEFERKNLEMLRSNAISIKKLLISKLSTVTSLTIPIQLIILIIYIVALKVADVKLTSFVLLALKWTILSILSSLSILCIQAFAYAKTRSFGQSIGISAIGAIGGFVLLFLNENLNKFYPYSQPMIALRSRALSDISGSDLAVFIIVNITYGLIFYRLTINALEKQ